MFECYGCGEVIDGILMRASEAKLTPCLGMTEEDSKRSSVLVGGRLSGFGYGAAMQGWKQAIGLLG